MKTVSTVDNYFKSIPEDKLADMERIRKAVQQLAPQAEETISYGIPTFKLNKKPLMYYAVYKTHLALYPVTAAMAKTMGDKLTPYQTGKGTLRFTEDKPLTDDLLKAIITVRIQELTGE